MVFALLHRPPKLDYLGLTRADIDGLEEEEIEYLWSLLEEHREATIEAYSGRTALK